MTKRPWVSLALLFAANTTFSWFLHSVAASWMAWVGVIGFLVIEALLLTTFSRGLRLLMRAWLTSDVGYFTVVICAAFLAAVALVWIKIFSYVLVLIAASVLARLELQETSLRRWFAFGILTCVSLAGLAFGRGVFYAPTLRHMEKVQEERLESSPIDRPKVSHSE